MKERISIALGAFLFVAGNILFFLWMQSNAALCNGLGYPICTGSP